MSFIKLSIVTLALVASASLAQAAGGIKGRPLQAIADSQRVQGIKGPALRPPSQQYLPPPPPPAPLPLPPAPAALPLPPPPPAPIQQAIKAGPGQVAPVFSPARVQPVLVQQQQQEPEPIIVQQQQQQEPEPSQQQQEIDPNAAAQDSALAIAAPAAAPVAAVAAAGSEEEANPRPEPYAFQYAFESGDAATAGSSQREEQQDANGRITGFYTLKGEDGRDRRVDYVADASGFRATISTNEMGTAPKDSADVDWNAQNPTDAQLRVAESATQAARQRALQNPRPIEQQLQQQLASSSARSQSKLSPPRSKTPLPAAASLQQQQQVQQQQQQAIAQQLQEPFEQIRQTELKGRARKSRHAPFYLFTI